MIETDIAIVGAGMAGASLAAEIGGRARVALIEAEAQPGYHATGRSAAFWSETYGGPAVQPLTSASGGFLAAGGFLHPRGQLLVAEAGDVGRLDALLADFAGSGVVLERRNRAEMEAMVPGLRPNWVAGVFEPDCRDIDVAALHGHYLREALLAGVTVLCDARVVTLSREGGAWRIGTPAGELRARVLVNAAGAWASEISGMAGARPIAITPYRRTMAQILVDPPAPATMPVVMDVAGRAYFRPESGGRLWLTPHDEIPSPPCDAAPEELDVAIAIDRMEGMVDWTVRRVERRWAGLRSFAPDRAPVYGFDPSCRDFFWFAGQGGFGIQTAPAAAMIGAALLLGAPLPDPVRAISVERYAPTRF